MSLPQTDIHTHATGPAPSQLQSAIISGVSTTSPHPAHLQQLALQIKHNLQHQHNWRDLTIHHFAPRSAANDDRQRRIPLRRPMISGLPPQRLYIHPDEQIAMLQEARNKSNSKATEDEKDSTTPAVDLQLLAKAAPEREWVLPSHLNELWTLREFGEAFDDLTIVPPSVEQDDAEDDLSGDVRGDQNAQESNRWRTTKRVLLATQDDDSTVVYYIVHDGIVKPRQN